MNYEKIRNKVRVHMNILVIGNGFDLAHGLPTSYKEFLKFVLESEDMCSRFQKNGLGAQESASAVAEIKEMIKDNFWINHFEKVSECGENWIDFETEISKVIQEIDAVRKLINEARRNPMEEAKYYREIENQYAGFSEKFSLDDVWDNPKGMQLVKENLLRDLNRLTHCLEIYLCQYVNKIEINGKEIEMLKNLQINHVLSFNYTNTFERIYGNCRDGVKYHFIHGKADIKNNADTCNMILGIDEYLTDTERDSDNEFIEFKKFFQRIYKGTGAEYKKWIHRTERKKKEFPTAHYEADEIYILGHSLDVSDKDVLSEILLCPNANVHIIYHNKKALADKIANVVKIIGQDKLIEKSYKVIRKIHKLILLSKSRKIY